MNAEQVFGIGACVLCIVLLAALVKKSNKEYALLMSLTAAVLLLMGILRKAEPLMQQIASIADRGMFEQEYLLVMLKAVGIAIAGQTVSALCKDAGESALAQTVDLGAKITILSAAIPVLQKILEYLEEIIKL